MSDRPDDLERLRSGLRDGLYVAVGFGVLGYQRLRIAQRAVAERLGAGGDEPEPPRPREQHRPWLDLRDPADDA